ERYDNAVLGDAGKDRSAQGWAGLGQVELNRAGRFVGLVQTPAEVRTQVAQVGIGVQRLLDHVGRPREDDDFAIPLQRAGRAQRVLRLEGDEDRDVADDPLHLLANAGRILPLERRARHDDRLGDVGKRAEDLGGDALPGDADDQDLAALAELLTNL